MALLSLDCLPMHPFPNARGSPKRSYFLPKCNCRASTVERFEFQRTVERKRANTRIFPQKKEIIRREVEVTTEEKELVSECFSFLDDWSGNTNFLMGIKLVHARAIKLGFILSDNLIGSRILLLYVKNFGLLEDARLLFDEIPHRTITTYASLIGSSCKAKKWIDVILLVQLMVMEGFCPDKFLLPSIFKACSELGKLKIGRMIHAYVIRKELEVDVFVGNSLIDMYSKNGDLRYSQNIFHTMKRRDVVSWTTLVSAYSDVGMLEEAKRIFDSMKTMGVEPDLISWNTLISGFAKNGDIDMAYQLLCEMQKKGLKPDISSWNGIISGCVHNGLFKEALDVFREAMVIDSINSVTIASILPVFSDIKASILGREIHSYAIKHNIQTSPYIEVSLIDMYSKCGKINHAEKLFDQIKTRNIAVWNGMISAYVNERKMEDASKMLQFMKINGITPDVITYNTLISGYSRIGKRDEAYTLLDEMVQVGLNPSVISLNALVSGFQQFGHTINALKLLQLVLSPGNINGDHEYDRHLGLRTLKVTIQPNAITLTSCLAACSDLNLLNKGKEIHGYILKNYFESNLFVLSALVDMYSKCRDINSAKNVFNGIQDKSDVSWNILMAGYNYNEKPAATLNLLPRMLGEGYSPNSTALTLLLAACSSTGNLFFGKILHCFAVKIGIKESNLHLLCSIIDMYGKCGSISDANLTFRYPVRKDVGIWNSMISGYAIHGMVKEAIDLFEELKGSDIRPDDITFIAVLSACVHGGLVEEGWRYFYSMDSVYGIVPKVEHYTCMISIIGDSGLLEEALDFMEKMPCKPDAHAWAALLRSSRLHSNVSVGQIAAKALIELEPNNASNYIVLSNIYIVTGLFESAKRTRFMIRARGLKLAKQCSWVFIRNEFYKFEVGDSSHRKLDEILVMWDKLANQLEEEGYSPDDPIFDYEQDLYTFTCFHTEKLAISFGLLSSYGSPICITKNIRMCIDCHTSAKFISKIEGREIFLMDGSFYHHFKDGKCSCRDRW